MNASTSPGSKSLLNIDGLVVRYGSALALNGVSLDLARGESLAIVGSNGAGKSTLARAISGLVPTTGGHINFAGQDIGACSGHRRRRLGIVYLPEGRGVFPDLTVQENLRMATVTLSRRARTSAIRTATDLFPALGDRRSTPAGLLSGGEQQMLSLARAFTTSPRLIIADELSLGLAPKLVDLVFERLAQLRAADVAVIVIEQFIHKALAFADNCILLRRGETAWQGPSVLARDGLADSYLGGTGDNDMH